MPVNEYRWIKLCQTLNILPDTNEYHKLLKAYQETHRAYHTVQHLCECLAKLDWAKANGWTENTSLLEIALWYHDAVYQPQAKDNELESAEWANRFLSQSGVDQEICDYVSSLIMETCHREIPNKPLHQLMVDIDLSILASEAKRLQEYEQQIRQEYHYVPWLLYKEKRIALLNHFLTLPQIYNTDLFHAEYEQKARENIKQLILKLASEKEF
jgi:predicted metal-dependent HD superfamily phosphohydrolase